MIIKILALVLMASFYICYFTKMISQKRQGIDTDQFLIEAFGDEYLNYRKKVCRYLGRKFWA